MNHQHQHTSCLESTKLFEVRHEVIHFGEVTDHFVSSHRSLWRARLSAWWHAARFLGGLDMIYIREKPELSSYKGSFPLQQERKRQ